MPDLSHLVEGDAVIVYETYRTKGSRATVVKVGRKLLTVEYPNGFTEPKKFQRTTGRSGGQFTARLSTPDIEQQIAFRNGLITRLKEAGLVHTHIGWPIPNEKILAILEILESEQ